jgi:SNF2 family DNA or RNA helicase
MDLMGFVRFSYHDSSEEDDVLYDATEVEEWATWRDTLKADENWRSSRITALIKVFNQQRDLDPYCSVIIFDESVFFLDIVQIAFANMYEPVECLRYDGRELPSKRGKILKELEKAQGAKVLLMSRATSGLGLDITSANIVIQCGPWWKVPWEEQAFKRVWKTGQTREVTYITLFAQNSDAEKYKAELRDRKHEFNSKAINAITRGDDQEPQVWDDFH